MAQCVTVHLHQIKVLTIIYIYIYRAYVGVMPGNDVIVTLNADDQSLSDNNISDITSFEFYVEPIPYGSVVISTDESHGPIQLIQ